MTEHDRIRMDRAVQALSSTDLEVISDALLGLQSTDAPELVELYDELQAHYDKLRKP